MNPDREPAKKDNAPPSSPYGPQPRGVDEAAGGADSSPHETEPPGGRAAKADDERRKGRNTDPGGTANAAP
jgi:hypothetical protein